MTLMTARTITIETKTILIITEIERMVMMLEIEIKSEEDIGIIFGVRIDGIVTGMTPMIAIEEEEVEMTVSIAGTGGTDTRTEIEGIETVRENVIEEEEIDMIVQKEGETEIGTETVTEAGIEIGIGIGIGIDIEIGIGTGIDGVAEIGTNLVNVTIEDEIGMTVLIEVESETGIGGKERIEIIKTEVASTKNHTMTINKTCRMRVYVWLDLITLIQNGSA